MLLFLNNGESQEEGRSLRLTAAHFDVDVKTLRWEFREADIPIRPRRGWANAEHF